MKPANNQIYPEYQSGHAVKQLLFEEREYFNSLIEHIDDHLIEEWTGSNKTFEALLETRRQLIQALDNQDNHYLYELIDHEHATLPEQSSATYLTHTLIIIDAKILDLLHNITPGHS